MDARLLRSRATLRGRSEFVISWFTEPVAELQAQSGRRHGSFYAVETTLWSRAGIEDGHGTGHDQTYQIWHMSEPNPDRACKVIRLQIDLARPRTPGSNAFDFTFAAPGA